MMYATVKAFLTLPPCESGEISVVVVTTLDPPCLLESETTLIDTTTHPDRARQVRAGRAAARLALSDLGGAPDTPIPRGTGREPLFPPPWKGSISHTDRWAVAAVSTSPRILSLGIDAQPFTNISARALKKIATRDELTWAQHAPLDRGPRLFCAKEAIYKCLWPVVRRYIGFHEASLIADETSMWGATLSPPLDAAVAAVGRLEIFTLIDAEEQCAGALALLVPHASSA